MARQIHFGSSRPLCSQLDYYFQLVVVVRSKMQAHYNFQLDHKMGTVVVVQQENHSTTTSERKDTEGVGDAKGYGQTFFAA